MFEKVRLLSLNSFEKVLRLQSHKTNLTSAFQELEEKWERAQISSPQFLSVEQQDSRCEVWVTGPAEVLQALEAWIPSQKEWSLAGGEWASVTATCAGATSAPLAAKLFAALAKDGLAPVSCRWSALSFNFLVPAPDRVKTVQSLHALVSNSYLRFQRFFHRLVAQINLSPHVHV